MQGSNSHLRAYTALLFILIIVVGFLYALYSLGLLGSFSRTPVQSSPFPPTAPAPTQADLVTAQQGFNYLVSYTVSGFHPASLTMKDGETIRFTDNSPNAVTIAGSNDASSTLQQGMYWQFMATKTGTLNFTAGTFAFTVTVTK